MRVIMTVKAARRGGGVSVSLRKDRSGRDSVRDVNAGEAVYGMLAAVLRKALDGTGSEVEEDPGDGGRGG